MEQLYAPGIMFGITVLVTSFFSLPITRFAPKSKLVRFYWNGFWMFLVAIAAFAGAGNTLMLFGQDALSTANALLSGIIAAFVVFVMVAWFRLCGAALWAGIKRWRKSRANNTAAA